MVDNPQNSAISDNSYEGKALVSFPAETLILREGEVNLDMYKIIQGRAEMYTGYGTDKEVLLGIIGPGACFGELGLLLQAKAIYTIIAYTDVYAIRVTEDRMGNFIQDNHTTILQIMKNMANTIAIMQHQIMSLQEELNSLQVQDNRDFEDMKKEILRSYYNRERVNMKGAKMFYMNDDRKKRK